MQHKGEIVKKAVSESGFPITKLTQKLGKSRRWMYHLFENPNVPLDHILAIGKIIHHDFYSEINELKVNTRELHDIPSTYNAEEDNPVYWKNKYFNLLEEYHLLLKKVKED